MLNIIVAHKAEAQPLIEYYSLVKTSALDYKTYRFTLYRKQSVQLIISGQGFQRAGFATQALIDQDSFHNNSMWLNFGVAGSALFDQGTLAQAAKVQSEQLPDTLELSTKVLASTGLNSATVCTVSVPEERYQSSYVYDMELGAIATELNSVRMLEKLSAIKLICDGPSHPISQLTLRDIQLLIESKRPQLYEVLSTIQI